MKKKILTAVISGLMVINIGTGYAYATGSQSLSGYNASQISTSTSSSGANISSGNGSANASMGGSSAGSSKSGSGSKKPSSGGGSSANKSGSGGSSGRSGNAGTPGSSSSSSNQSVNPPQYGAGIGGYQITQGWKWSLSEWGNRNGWFDNGGNGGGQQPWYTPGQIISRAKTIFWGGTDPSMPVSPTAPTQQVTYTTTSTSKVTATNLMRNRRLLRYDWTLTNTSDKSLPVDTASTSGLNLTWTFTYTGKYHVVADPGCVWDVGYETTDTTTTVGSDGTVSTHSSTVFHKTGEYQGYYSAGIKVFDFTIGINDLNRPTVLPPPNQVKVNAVDELVE